METSNNTVKKRVHDYEPAYPVILQAGSPETQRTAWGKYIEENKRLYRLLNENLNYYEDVAYQLNTRMDKLEADLKQSMADLENRLNTKFTDLENRLNTKFTDLENKLTTQMNDLKKDVKVYAYGNPVNSNGEWQLTNFVESNCIFIVQWYNVIHGNSDTGDTRKGPYFAVSNGKIPDTFYATARTEISFYITLACKAWNFT